MSVPIQVATDGFIPAGDDLAITTDGFLSGVVVVVGDVPGALQLATRADNLVLGTALIDDLVLATAEDIVVLTAAALGDVDLSTMPTASVDLTASQHLRLASVALGAVDLSAEDFDVTESGDGPDVVLGGEAADAVTLSTEPLSGLVLGED